MAKQSGAQRKTVGRVMHEYKHGELKRGRGGKVKSRKQAVAIAMKESGSSKKESPKKNKQNLAKTKRRESQGRTGQARTERKKTASQRARGGGKTRAELYAQAKRRNIAGRSKMSKAQLEHALKK